MRRFDAAVLKQGSSPEVDLPDASPEVAAESDAELDFLGQLAHRLSTSRAFAQETLRDWMVESIEARKSTSWRGRSAHPSAPPMPRSSNWVRSRGPPPFSTESNEDDSSSKI